MPIPSIERYRQLEANLRDPEKVQRAGRENVARARADMASFRGSNPHLFQPGVDSIQGTADFKADNPTLFQSGTGEEGIAGTELPRLQGEAQLRNVNAAADQRSRQAAAKQGYNIDLTADNGAFFQQLGQQDPGIQDSVRAGLLEEARDPKLPNASGLKVFQDPPEYVPQGPAAPNPFSTLPEPPKDTQYFYEPGIDEFRAAASGGRLGAKLKQEFPGIPDPLRLIDKDIESSTTFRAYQDTAWRHALAEAVKTNTPIKRVKFAHMDPLEKAQASALDPAVAASSGALQGMTMGLADPILRSIMPESAEAERRSRMRNSKTAVAGELAGGLSPGGLPSRIAGGVTKAIGKGLGALGIIPEKAAGRAFLDAGTSVASGAATGAIDAQSRALADAAADALDAGDSATKALARLHGALSGDTMAHGAGYGAAGGAVGHGLGSLAGAGAQRIVDAEERLPTLLRARSSGVKMSATGGPVRTPEMRATTARAAVQRTSPQDLLATEARDPILTQRLREQESAIAKGERETQQAYKALGDSTVDLQQVGEDIKDIAREMPGATPEAAPVQTAIRRYGRKLIGMERVTPEKLDALIEEADRQAKLINGKSDPHWVKVAARLKQARDDLKFEKTEFINNGGQGGDDTEVVHNNFALRDDKGNNNVVTDFSGMKARHNREMRLYEFDNRMVGLPERLRADTMPLGDAPDREALQAVAESKAPSVRRTAAEQEGFTNTLKSVADVDHLERTNKLMQMADRAGVKDKLVMIQQLRDADDWSKLLANAINHSGLRPKLNGNQLLRTVPTLHSLSGGMPKSGLPQVEATPYAMHLMDRYLNASVSGDGARSRIVQGLLNDAVPSAEALHLRGGQGARTAGALSDDRKPQVNQDFTPEETAALVAILKNLGAMTQQRKAQ